MTMDKEYANGLFGSFWCILPVSKIHSFENGFSYVHNISTEPLESEANGGGSVYSCSLRTGILTAQTVSAIQSGVNLWFNQATCPHLPPDPDMDGNVS